MEELVKKLRYESTWRDDYPEDKDMLLQAADAIEQLDKDLERAKEWASFWEKEANEALKKFQVSVASKPRWIPVTERLPNENDDVLIYGERTGLTGEKYRDILLTDLKEFLHQGYKPIAWMPLPEPPKEKEG